MENEDHTQEWLLDEIAKLLKETNPIEQNKRFSELAKLCKHLPGVTLSTIKATFKAMKDTAKAEARVEAAENMAPHLAVMNDRHFLWRNGSKIRIGELMERQLNGHTYIDLVGYTAPDFRVACANQIFMGDAVADMWLASPDRREITGTTLSTKHAPFTIVGERMNIWQGFGVEPEAGDHVWFTKHILKLIGPKYAGYLLRWIAYGFQHPERPIGTAIMLIGKPGTGKGLLCNTLRSMWGPHGQTIYTPEALTGKFNAHLRHCCFAFLDEPPWAGEKRGVDVLKHIITEPTIRVEPKGLDSEEVDNRLKIIAATNHQWVAQIEQSDRRFVVFEVNEELHGDETYFTELATKADDPACKAAALHYLLNLDLSGFRPERDRPMTRIYAQQKASSLTGDWLFWRRVIEAGSFNIIRGGQAKFAIPDSDMGGQFGPGAEHTKPQIYRCYTEWHDFVGRGSAVIPDVFWKNFHRWAGKVNTRRDQYVAGGERQSYITLPPLSVLGRRLREHLGEKFEDGDE